MNYDCPICKKVGDVPGLCGSCELRFSLDLLRLIATLRPLRDMLDATVHYGGHEVSRTQTATPPTPIRLGVLDLLDDIDAAAYELHRTLIGCTLAGEYRLEDVVGTLCDCAQADNLGTVPDAARWVRRVSKLNAAADMLLFPPDLHAIGHCPNELCGVMLYASDGQHDVTCGVCGTTSSVADIQLRTLYRLCWDTEHVGSAAQIARTFTGCGVPLRRNTITQWAARGKIQSVKTVGTTPFYRYSDVFRQANFAMKNFDCHHNRQWE